MNKVLPLTLFLVLIACGQVDGQSETANSATAPKTVGIVLEKQDVDNYTYIKLETGEGEMWLATSPLSVEEGDTVNFAGGMMMVDFYSRTLDRTFDRILFVGTVELVDSKATSRAVPNDNSLGVSNPHAGLEMQPTGAQSLAELEPIEGGVSIAEIFAGSGELEGKQVKVHARVVKVNSNIMGKNWVTLQDGTGTVPDNQLIATTQEMPAVGDDLIVTAVVRNDIDLGSGYKYRVLLEDAMFD